MGTTFFEKIGNGRVPDIGSRRSLVNTFLKRSLLAKNNFDLCCFNLLDSCFCLIGSDFVRENNYNLWQWSRLLFFLVFLFLPLLL